MYQMQIYNGGGMQVSHLFDSTTDCYRYLNNVEPYNLVKITYGYEAADGVFEVEEVIDTFWTEN